MSKNAVIQSETLQFLKRLSRNNNREWFGKNKANYEHAHENMIAFADSLLAEMSKIDQIETASGKKSLHRIYRDIRFSKDKSPYKDHWSGGFRRATAYLRGGYYFHISPQKTLIATGFFGPNKEDLKQVRDQIQLEPERLRAILNERKFKKVFGELQGEQLKVAPKGYDKNDPAIDLLVYKRFYLRYQYDIEEVTKPGFARKVAGTFNSARPFLDYMSEILTTDLNGVPII